MLHHNANEGRVVSQDWHQFRQTARKTAFSEEEFSAIERERYNLDKDDDWAPANITGEQNPETYKPDVTGLGQENPEADIRDNPGRA